MKGEEEEKAASSEVGMAQVFTEQDKPRGSGGSGAEYTTQPDTSPDTSPVSSPEPSFRPRLPTYFLSLRQGTRIGRPCSIRTPLPSPPGYLGQLSNCNRDPLHLFK